jgi:hypothetical protein
MTWVCLCANLWRVGSTSRDEGIDFLLWKLSVGAVPSPQGSCPPKQLQWVAEVEDSESRTLGVDSIAERTSLDILHDAESKLIMYYILLSHGILIHQLPPPGTALKEIASQQRQDRVLSVTF